MSDKKNLSDYNRPRTDLNRLLPEYNLRDAKILEGLNHNLFNRFLTKDEVERVVGIIGSDEFTTEDVNQILEPTPYRQANQLQPIVYNKVGNVDWFMSFVDFMNRLERLGINLDRFDEWGNSLQFNWLPPIDIDKIINYQDYFWDSSGFDDPPQYITIKNACTWVTARQIQMYNGIASVMPSYEVVGEDDGANEIWIAGNQTLTLRVGEIVTIISSSVDPIAPTVVGTTYDVGNDRTQVQLSGYTVVAGDGDVYSSLAETEVDILAFNEGNRTLTIGGDRQNLFTEGYIFSVEQSTTSQPSRLLSVVSSVYDNINNRTTITVNEAITGSALFDYTLVSTTPLIRSIQAEFNVVCNAPYSVAPFGVYNETDLGNIIWARYNTILDTGVAAAEGTNLGSQLFTDSNGAKDFFAAGVQDGDILRATNDPEIWFNGDHTITNVVNANILQIEGNLYNQTDIDYIIVRERVLTDIESATTPVALEIDQLWYDTENDQLRQWDGAIWDVRVENFSLLVDVNRSAHIIDLTQDDDWSEQNKWVHRTEINNFTGKSRAQQPIIEYFPYLRLSEHSFAEKQWRYRRNDTVSYASVTTEPTLFELIDTRVVSGGEVAFQDSTTLLFDEKFGNLTSDLVAGLEIQLGDFSVNTGTYTVVSSEYVQLAPNTRYRTRVTLAEDVVDALDVPVGAFVAPLNTSEGDPWVTFETYHWQLEGIEDISASSIEPVPNPMLTEIVNTSIDLLADIEHTLGLVFEEFKPRQGFGSGGAGLTFTLDNSLHDLALYEDFQEGDIRVYVNGVRQYGNYVDVESAVNPGFVGAIIFDTSVTISEDEVVRVELGEYASTDVGKRNVLINTVSGPEQFNIVDLRRVEQVKSERSQYPFFNVYNVNKEPFIFATEIFRYQDDPTGTYFADIDQRIFFDPVSQDYRFQQRLLDPETGELYKYYDSREVNDEFQTIWKRGLNNEQFVPDQANGFWEIPNQLYYNVKHENRELIELTEVFRHFNTIVEEQTSPGIVSDNFTNVYHIDNNVNYGLGGRIKEHNDGFDILLSAMFVNNVNPIDLIQFGHDRYLNNQIVLKEIFADNLVDLFNETTLIDVDALTDFVVEEVKDVFEKNDRLDQWFGDSTTFIESTNLGVKNHIATIPFLKLLPKFQPYLLEEGDLLQVVSHDGHRQDVSFNQATIESFFRLILQDTNSDTQVVTVDADAFPALINGSPPTQGDYLVRTVTSEKLRKLYRFNSSNEWELLDLSKMFANIILNIEESLFEVLGDEALPSNFVTKFDFQTIRTDPEYTLKVREQFSRYTRSLGVETPFVNDSYVTNDPFTWNYAFTPVTTDPLTGTQRTDVRASWQGLYDLIYNTPYPHLEPWRLQGYQSKPSFWDTEYADPTETRKWLSTMWDNILTGTIPIGTTAPDGNVGLGLPGQITNIFTYVPVNIESTATTDGYEPDTLLPPYWNSTNSPNPAVRSLHDASLQEFIITPNAGYEFGQLGPDEWEWSVSAQRLYDDLIVSFKIQPMRFMNQSFGPELIDCACLQVDDRINKVASHENIEWHGDVVNGNEVYQVDGLNQWYVHFNRYNGFDGISSEFRQMWTEWDSPLTYQFGSFIDTQNFKISSDIFDVTTNDYEIIFKRALGIRDVWLDGLDGTLLSAPSAFASSTDSGIGWTVSLTNTSPVGRPINSFGVQNYPIRVTAGDPTFKTFRFSISAAEVQESVGFDVVLYSETAGPSVATSLLNDGTLYFADVLFNGVDTVNLEIEGQLAQTFGDLVDQINLQLGSNGNAFIEDGNVIIESGLTGGTTSTVITDAGLFATASALFSGTTGNNIATIAFDKVFYVNDNITQWLPVGSTFDVVDSTNFDGTYTVVTATYSPDTELTTIQVIEDITITDSTVDGFIEPETAVDMPDEWVTGTALHWSSNGTIPAPFNSVTPFYLIRVDDRQFQLALTREAALAGTAITPTVGSSLQSYIGRVKNTFTALGGVNAQLYWKQHFVDNRVVNVLPTPVTISGVQNIVDFINGYGSYLEDQGFVFGDIDSTNRDQSTGRARDWQFETEKFIDFMYSSRNEAQELREQYTVVPDAAGNSFTSTDTIQWVTGTRVTLDTLAGGQLPTEFDNPVSDSVPYFVIQAATVGRFQLAASELDARNGLALPFTDNGSGDIVVRLTPARARFPSQEINPHIQTVFIDHDTGVVSDIHAGSNLDLLTDQRVYDEEQENLGVDDLIVSRKDLRTQIELSSQRIAANEGGLETPRYIGGMHLFFDGYEHIIKFNDYSTDDSLIYDSFLGINTPRFFMEFDRQTEFTLRPNVGGTVVLDEKQVQNLESAIESLRFAYSTYRSKEGDLITDKVRDMLGYDGPFDFADDAGITDKSQFIFYRGSIQKKGTNFAANAYTNQLTYDDIDVDEFWTYRLACYGDSKERIYPELKLFSTDVVRRELRLEFVAPLTDASNSTFQAIGLYDETRWFDQPDQVESLSPRDRFYLNPSVQERFENVVASDQFFLLNEGTINEREYLQLRDPADAAFVNYRVPASSPPEYVGLTEGNDYVFITKTLIQFIGSITPNSGFEVNVSSLAYNYSAQNPAKIINRKVGEVVTEVPIWNPARQQYYSKAIYGVDFRSGNLDTYQLVTGLGEGSYDGSGDNGSFTTGGGYSGGETITLSNGATVSVDSLGSGGSVDEFDILTEGSRVEIGQVLTQVSVSNGTGTGFTLTPNTNTVSVSGKKSDDPARYSVPADTGDDPDNNFWDSRQKDEVWFYTGPEGYLPFDDPAVETDLDTRLKNWGRLADWGEIEVYQWTESDVTPTEYDAIAASQEEDANIPINERKTGTTRKLVYRNLGTATDPIWITEEDEHYDFVIPILSDSDYPSNLFADSVEVYLDGVFVESVTFFSSIEFFDYVSGLAGTLVHIVKRATVPTQQQIDDVEYKLDTPYSVVNRINPISGNEEFTYYFWVQDRRSNIPVLGGPEGNITLTTIEEGLRSIPTPYMIPNNVVNISSVGFADLFSTNSPHEELRMSYEFPFVYNQVIVKGLAGTVQSDDDYTLRFTRDFALRDRLSNPEKQFRLKTGQTEANFDGVTGNGTFTAGQDYAALDVINLSNGSTSPAIPSVVRVDTVSSGAITSFTILSIGKDFDAGTVLTQTSTTGAGQDFTLSPSLLNVQEILVRGSSPIQSELQRKNIHWEWKLFREKQFNKIDIELWNAVIESLLGFEYDGDPLTGEVEISPTPTPSPSPSPTSTPAAVTPSATPTNTPPVTPTLTPNPTPTSTVTPSVTATPVIQPTPTPSITPTNTPVASPTPSPSEQAGLFLDDGDPFGGTLAASSFGFIDGGGSVSAIINVYDDSFPSTAFNVFRSSIVATDNLLWLYPPTGDSSDYDVKVDITSGTLTSGTVGSWVNMGTTQQWRLQRDTIGNSSASGTISIRDANTLAVLFTRAISFSVIADFLGGFEGEGGFIF